MKRNSKLYFWILVSLSIGLIWVLPLSAQAGQLGFWTSVASRYEGEYEILKDQKVSLQSAGMPWGWYMDQDKLRIGFFHFSQQAHAKVSSDSLTKLASASFEHDSLILAWNHGFYKRNRQSLYAVLGGVWVRSIMNEHLIYLESGSVSSASQTRRSTESFDPGFVFSLGASYRLGRAFIAAEAMQIRANVTYEPNQGFSDETKLDVSGKWLLLSFGLAF